MIEYIQNSNEVNVSEHDPADPLGLQEPLFPDTVNPSFVPKPPTRPAESKDTLVERERWVRQVREDIADAQTVRLMNLNDQGFSKDPLVDVRQHAVEKALEELLIVMLEIPS